MFTTGKIIFASIFTITFIVAMLWSYKKDSFINAVHFKGASKILILTIIILTILLVFVKTRHLF
jgi:hypothetical protein